LHVSGLDAGKKFLRDGASVVGRADADAVSAASVNAKPSA